MSSLFSTSTQTLHQYFIGVTLPTINPADRVEETPIRWLKLSRDLTFAINYDQLPIDTLLDNLIIVETGIHRKIRLARIVATTSSDLVHMRQQSNIPTRSIKSFMGARSQWINPSQLLDEHIYETLRYLYHDYDLQSHLAIYEDAAAWQALLVEANHSPKHMLLAKKRRHFSTYQRSIRKYHQTRI